MRLTLKTDSEVEGKAEERKRATSTAVGDTVREPEWSSHRRLVLNNT